MEMTDETIREIMSLRVLGHGSRYIADRLKLRSRIVVNIIRNINTEINFLDLNPEHLNRKALIHVVNDLQGRLRDINQADMSEVIILRTVFDLSKSQGYILACLMSGAVTSKSSLIASYTQSSVDEAQNKTADVHICNLRAKLKSKTGDKIITTVRSLGYVIHPEQIKIIKEYISDF